MNFKKICLGSISIFLLFSQAIVLAQEFELNYTNYNSEKLNSKIQGNKMKNNQNNFNRKTNSFFTQHEIEAYKMPNGDIVYYKVKIERAYNPDGSYDIVRTLVNYE